ncbi:MAG: hypothetical protein ACTSYA_09320 [Candidatus Kariarchaeaceae archaeon]
MSYQVNCRKEREYRRSVLNKEDCYYSVAILEESVIRVLAGGEGKIILEFFFDNEEIKPTNELLKREAMNSLNKWLKRSSLGKDLVESYALIQEKNSHYTFEIKREGRIVQVKIEVGQY